MGLSRLSKRHSSVAGIRFPAPVPPFRRPHGFSEFAIRHRSAESFRRLGLPFRACRNALAGTLRGSGNPHGVFSPLQRHRRGGPPTRVSTPGSFHLQGFPPSWRLTPSNAFRPRGPVPLVGFIPPERFPFAEPCTVRLSCLLAVSDIACSCSEDQEVTMPRSFKALLPAKIRTRLEPIARAGRYSHGISYSSGTAHLS